MSLGSVAEVVAQPLPSHMTTTSSPPDSGLVSRLSNLRGVRWRINLCGLRSFSVDDLRRVSADSRRRYATSRRRLLIDPHITRHGHRSPDPVVDNPLSENPDSMWSRFFRNAELEKMVDQDLSRLYPEHGSYFQTSGCQSMLRRILLLWCLGHPENGYRQGMHELLAPLLYVLHADLHRLSEVQKLYEDHFTDKFDDTLFQEHDLAYSLDFNKSPDFIEESPTEQEKSRKVVSLEELDPDIQTIILLSDAYGAEGELGVVLSEKFLEHDVYSMFDALMSGAGGSVAMAEFFNPSSGVGIQTGLPPVIEASSALYYLLSVVDPSLYSHLVELGVEPQYFALRWLRVLFGREFSLEDLLVIWDEIFSYDNATLVKADDDDLRSSSGVLNSERGAFISAMAVSMMLLMRSSLLATETATFCLQRLLNFPENIDLEKLIEKAKSLLPLALDANASSSSIAAVGSYNQIKSKVVRGHSQSMDSGCSKNLLLSVPESYWEDKWRHMHKEEELRKEKSSSKQSLTQKKGWTHKVKLRLSRTESVPSSLKRDSKIQGHPPSVRRNLLHDLARQLGEDAENIGESEPPSTQGDPVHSESAARFSDDAHENLAEIEKTHSGQTTVSEENSAIFSDPPSPVRELANDSDKSSFASNTPSQDMNNEVRQSIYTLNSNLGDRSASVSDRSEVSAASSVSDFSQKGSTGSKERKSFSGRLQWLWKLGRQGSAEGPSSDKGADISGSKSTNGERYQNNLLARSFDEDESCTPLSVKVDVNDQNLIHTVRSLGHSMLENIQVIESVFEQNTCEAGSVDNNLSKSALVERGQVRAMSALKELRKISNVLSEM